MAAKTFDVALRPLDGMRPYDKNSCVNDHAVSVPATSLREFGFRQPIVVDEDGVIIVGHTWWMAVEKLGELGSDNNVEPLMQAPGDADAWAGAARRPRRLKSMRARPSRRSAVLWTAQGGTTARLPATPSGGCIRTDWRRHPDPRALLRGVHARDGVPPFCQRGQWRLPRLACVHDVRTPILTSRARRAKL
jgi:hypothetical protein